MKLLILTQAVDIEHPILGFFHRWIEEFAKHCEQVSVICLQEAKHQLPPNVQVYSLGKEENHSRLQYVIRFYKLLWKLHKDYDRVFVHMNQIYVLLAGLWWRLTGKRVSLWYMHSSAPVSLKMALPLVTTVYTGSEDSFPLKTKKLLVTGHGIDTTHFTPQEVEKTLDLITVGRITESKNLLALLPALQVLRNNSQVTLTIVGQAVTMNEKAYEAKVRIAIKNCGLTDAVIWQGKVEQSDLPQVLSKAKVFVTAAQNGSLDKAVLEAMACGLPVISMAPGTKSLLLDTAQTETMEAFTVELQKLLESREYLRPDYVSYIATTHSLQKLIPKLIA